MEDGNEKYKIMQEAINRNPLLGAWYQKERFNKFFELVFTHVLDIEDHFNKEEWQDRGTGHTHGVAWSKGMDDLLQAITDEDIPTIENIVNKFDDVISQCNPREDPKNSN